jgi:hypothetical protein
MWHEENLASADLSSAKNMPILPLDQPEPFAATLGVMLYPGTDDLEKRKAATFQVRWLSKPIERLHADGRKLPYSTLLHLTTNAGEELEDLDKRWWQATATGELLKTVFALYNTNAALASWNSAAKLATIRAAREKPITKRPAARSEYWAARRRYLSVSHLWAAWCIRELNFETRPEIGYDGCADFGSFLAEAEIIRLWGQRYRPSRESSSPILPPELWYVGDEWRPPIRQPGWPDTGKIPVLTIPECLLAPLKPAGRPPKRM